MKASSANVLIGRAVQLGLIDRNEGLRRIKQIQRNRRDKRAVWAATNDLIDLVQQAERNGRILTVGGEV